MDADDLETKLPGTRNFSQKRAPGSVSKPKQSAAIPATSTKREIQFK